MERIFLNIFFIFLFSSAFADEYTFTVGSYNVDGLPAYVGLWGSIKVNPDGPREDGTTLIGKKLKEQDWDVVGLNEDFNYHECLLSELSGEYQFGKWRGSISANGVVFSGFRGDTDGLEIMCKNDISFSDESWTEWCTYSGWIDDGNDGMARKGFRHYTVTLKSGVAMDVFILHADAGESSDDASARHDQFTQLAEAIKANDSGLPKLVMGDFNCIYCFDNLKSYFIDVLNATDHLTAVDAMIETCNDGVYPKCIGSYSGTYAKSESLDHIVYINDERSDWQIKADSYTLVESFTYDDGQQLSDHHPVCAQMTAKKVEPTGVTDIQCQPTHDNVRKFMKNGKLIIQRHGISYSVNGNIIK